MVIWLDIAPFGVRVLLDALVNALVLLQMR